MEIIINIVNNISITGNRGNKLILGTTTSDLRFATSQVVMFDVYFKKCICKTIKCRSVFNTTEFLDTRYKLFLC